MAYATVAQAPREFTITLPAFDAHLSLWRMVRDALAESRQAQVEREIETYLARTGGKFTDDTEREIEHICEWSSSRW